MEHDDLWQHILSNLHNDLSRPNFQTWLEPLTPVEVDDQLTLWVQVPNDTHLDWLTGAGAVVDRAAVKVGLARVRFYLHHHEDEDEDEGRARASSGVALHRHDHAVALLLEWGCYDAERLLAKHGDEPALDAIAYIRSRGGTIRNPGAYFRMLVAKGDIPPPLPFRDGRI